MKRFDRRRFLVASAIGGIGLAGCLGDDDPPGGETDAADGDGTGDADGNGTDDGDDSTDGGDDGEDGETAAIDWSREPGGWVATVRDGTLYGIEDFQEGSGGLVAIDASSGDREWTYGEAGGYSTYTAPVVDDAIYVGYGDDAVGSGAGELYALERDGTERWTAETGSVYHPPRLADGAVFVGADDGYAYAFETESGSERWSIEFESENSPADPTVEAVEDGLAYVSVDGTIRAIDAEKGSERWAYDTSRDRVSAVAVDDGVYYATWDEVGAVDGGDERWVVGLDSSKRIAGVFDGSVFVSRGYDVFAFDAEDGTKRWSDETDEERRVGATDDAVYLASDELRAFDHDGDEEWSTDLDGSDVGTVLAIDDSTYVTTDDAVYRVDRSGDVVASAEVADVGSLVVDDRVYAGTREAFYAIDL